MKDHGTTLRSAAVIVSLQARVWRKSEIEARLAMIRAAQTGVLLFRVYADGNYWAGAGWEDYAVSDFDAGECGGEGFVAGYARWGGQGARAAAGGTRQAVQP